MGQSKRIYEETQEWDAWEHLQDEDNFVPTKPKTKKVRKMKKDKPLFDRKRK
jgi:hypothetical protein